VASHQLRAVKLAAFSYLCTLQLKMDEHKLIEGIIQGDDHAFRELVSRYQDKVYNTLLSFIHDPEDSLDLSQDVFVEVYQSIGHFRKESSLSTWIYRIAVNKALNHSNKKKKYNFIGHIKNFMGSDHADVQEKPSGEKHPHDSLENKELSLQLQHAIDSLPKNQRIAFILCELDDLPYKEISSVMDISMSSVESLIFRARKSLQQKLLEYFQK
jgi:RNA polymerase sigma factor (sigma-70 family)